MANVLDQNSDLYNYKLLLSQFPENIANLIDQSMTESWRVYHGPWHLGRMYRVWNENFKHFGHIKEIIHAIALHDIVYDPTQKAPTNEYLSGSRFLMLAPILDLNVNQVLSVSKMIIASANHNAAENLLPHEFAFLDTDLEPLQSSDFVRNSRYLREEFSHLSDDQFETGRRKFLTHMLTKNIYSPFAPKSWEQMARQNIRSSL